MSQQGGERLVKLWLFIGTNGSGKSHNMRKCLSINQRNLIIPASRADKQWAGIPELKPVVRFVADPMDPHGRRQKPQWVIPGINSFTGNRVVHIEGDDAERKGIFRAVTHPQWGFHNGGLFMDDAKNYIDTTGNLPGHVRTFFGNRRLHMVDIFMAAWQYQHINADLYAFEPQLFVFNVGREPNETILEKIDNPEGFLAVHHRVRAMNAKLPHNRRWYFEPYPAIHTAHGTPRTAQRPAADRPSR